MNGNGPGRITSFQPQQQVQLDPSGHYLVIKRNELSQQVEAIRSPVMTTLDSLALLVNTLVGIVQALYAESAEKRIVQAPAGVKLPDKA